MTLQALDAFESRLTETPETVEPRDPSITYGLGYRTKRRPVPGRRIHEVDHYADESFRIPTLPLTGERLHRHAEIGTDGIRATADMHGLDLRVRPQGQRPKRRRRTSAQLRQEVAELRGRGMVPAAIADALNVSDRRLAGLLRELGVAA